MISSAMRLLTAVQAVLADSVVLISTAAIWETFSEISSEIFLAADAAAAAEATDRCAARMCVQCADYF